MDKLRIDRKPNLVSSVISNAKIQAVSKLAPEVCSVEYCSTKPAAVYVFGSSARNTSSIRSDVDLWIEIEGDPEDWIVDELRYLVKRQIVIPYNKRLAGRLARVHPLVVSQGQVDRSPYGWVKKAMGERVLLYRGNSRPHL